MLDPAWLCVWVAVVAFGVLVVTMGREEDPDPLATRVGDGAALALIVALLALVGCLWMGVRAHGAPVPARKTVRETVAADLVGEWAIECTSGVLKAGKGICWLAKDGMWVCDGWTETWLGRWQFEAGKLSVEEFYLDAAGEICERKSWRVKLVPGTLSGRIEGGGEFYLTPVKKAKPDA